VAWGAGVGRHARPEGVCGPSPRERRRPWPGVPWTQMVAFVLVYRVASARGCACSAPLPTRAFAPKEATR